MKQYKVLCDFYDSKDNDRLYHRGESYPHETSNADEKRIKELGTENNAIGIKLIDLPDDFKDEVELNPEEDNKTSEVESDKKKKTGNKKSKKEDAESAAEEEQPEAAGDAKE